MLRFEELSLTRRFERSYRAADARLRRSVRKAVRFLLENPGRPGLQLEPIQPSKLYCEVRLSRGDRLVIRPEGSTAHLIDVVEHDDVGRYG